MTSFLIKWLGDNDIKIYSTYNEGKCVATERFIRTLKHKIYKRNIYKHLQLCQKSLF